MSHSRLHGIDRDKHMRIKIGQQVPRLIGRIAKVQLLGDRSNPEMVHIAQQQLADCFQALGIVPCKIRAVAIGWRVNRALRCERAGSGARI